MCPNTVSSPNTMVAEVQPNTMTSSGRPGRMRPAPRRDILLHGAQRFRCGLRRVVDARLVDADARQPDDPAELVLDRLVGREHDQSDRRACGDPAIQPMRQMLPVDDQVRRGARSPQLPPPLRPPRFLPSAAALSTRNARAGNLVTDASSPPSNAAAAAMKAR